MKKLAITLTALLVCAVSSASYAACPVKQPCDPCNVKTKSDCPQAFDVQPACDPCAEKQAYMENRQDLYCKLQLNQQQVLQAKNVDSKYYDELYKLKECYKAEKCKLDKMKCEGACKDEIKCQKDKVKALKKDIKDKQKQYCECFKSILNKCQLDKFKKCKADYNCTCKSTLPEVNCDCCDPCEKTDCGCK